MKSCAICLLTVVALAMFSNASAATYTLEPIADARILSYYPSQNFGSDSYLSVYTDIAPTNFQHTLIQFDFSSITLATNEKVQLATLTLKANTSFGTNPSNRVMEVYRVVSSWTESGATWLNRDATHPRTNEGGDFVGTNGQPYAVSTNTALDGQAVTWDVTALVSEWMANAATNDGLLLKSTNGNHLHFYTRAANINLRPTLTVVTGLSPLHVSGNSGQILIWWTGEGTLQEKTNLSPAITWENSARTVNTSNGTNSVTIPAPTGNRFFRLQD